MDLITVARVVRGRAVLRTHDRWSQGELRAHRARAVRDLRRFAVARSPFYADLHRGLEDAPLDRLPVVTKGMLMERFDEVVTDREIRLADVEAYLERGDASRMFRDRYRVTATGGTTGRRGVFLADREEWLAITISYARAMDWAGVAPSPTRRLRQAVVTSRHLSHQSSLVGETSASRFLPTLRLDAVDPVDAQVDALNAFRPHILVAYVSCLRVLAAEQQAGRLAIRPLAILASSEVMTDDSRRVLREAFGVAPTNLYGATETAVIASECQLGRMHEFGDLLITEVVDDDGRPVPLGEYGARLLVTVLFSRTQPLIRYELSDRVRDVEGGCPDGRPYRVIGGIDGRSEDVLTLGGVAVHPNVFDVALEALPVTGWQVIETGGSLLILLARAPDTLQDADVVARVTAALEACGSPDVPVSVERVDAIPRTTLGKAPLVRRATTAERDPARPAVR